MKPLVLPDVPIYNEIVAELKARGLSFADVLQQRHEELIAAMEGRADTLLRLLAARGVAVDDEARARIVACRNLDTLDRWLERAVTAMSTAAVLADNGGTRWRRHGDDSMGMAHLPASRPMRATVRNGRLVMDEPTSMPEGTVLSLIVDDEGDDLDAPERAALGDAIERAEKSAQATPGREAQDVIASLRGR